MENLSRILPMYDLKELQTLWIMNAHTALYTCGEVFNEEQKKAVAFEYAMNDVSNFVNKTGPFYSLIPDDIYMANALSSSQAITVTKKTDKTFDANSLRRKMVTQIIGMINGNNSLRSKSLHRNKNKIEKRI